MTVVFIGHGSPMNAVEDNKYTMGWEDIARKIPKPEAILVVSAHWYTKGTKINDSSNPTMTYDMYGFPKELYEIVYDCSGAPIIAHEAINLISRDVTIDNSWGIDHGAWSVLVKMYPKKDIPVFQLSIDENASPEEHYEIGKQLKSLREKGVLILGSGNVVHNLRMVNWSMEDGFDWADEFDDYTRDNILQKNNLKVVNYAKSGQSAKLAVPTTDHFYPLLYVLGASDEKDQITVYNNENMMGSLSMTSYIFQ
ncbi:MAG: 4,5-DOPA-extradiol-dioxygenase [Mobilitalea sp.]